MAFTDDFCLGWTYIIGSSQMICCLGWTYIIGPSQMICCLGWTYIIGSFTDDLLSRVDLYNMAFTDDFCLG